VILATKVGLEMGEGKKGLKPAYIHQAVEDSLQRLQTDYIDLYQAHKGRSGDPPGRNTRGLRRAGEAGKGSVHLAHPIQWSAAGRRPGRRAASMVWQAISRCSRTTI